MKDAVSMKREDSAAAPREASLGRSPLLEKPGPWRQRAHLSGHRAGPHVTLQAPAGRCMEKPEAPENTSDKGP